MSAGSTSVRFAQPTPTTVTVDFSATYPATDTGGISECPSTSGFSAFVIVNPRRPGVLRIETRTDPTSPTTVFESRGFIEQRIRFNAGSSSIPLTISERTATFTFTPDP